MRMFCSPQWVHMIRCDAVHMIRCDAVHMVRCDVMHLVRCDVMHLVRCCSSLYKHQSVEKPNLMIRIIGCGAYGPMRCDASGPMRCDASGPMLFFFVQTSVG